MAREWWQFSNWPDGTSGDDPAVKDQDPNAVEIWQPGTLPRPCTVFRQEWLNQFVAWKYYLSHVGPNQTRTWLKAYYDPNEHPYYSSRTWYNDVPCANVPVLGGDARPTERGLIVPAFWVWLATLDCPYALPSNFSHSANDESGEEYEDESSGRGFVANTAFNAIRAVGGDGKPTDLGLPLLHTMPLGHGLPNHYFFSYRDIYASPICDLQHNVLQLLKIIREHYDSAGVDGAGVESMPIGGVRGRQYFNEYGYTNSGQWYSKYYWIEATHSNYSSYPFPSYSVRGGKFWDEHDRASYPYAEHDAQNNALRTHGYSVGAFTSHVYDGEGNFVRPIWSRLSYITAFDVFRLTDTNYRYAIISTGQPDDSKGGGYAVPPQCGYCHAVFDLATNINLNNPPSRIIHVAGLGNGNFNFIQTNAEISVDRGIEIVSFPYDRIPDEYKGPDWPTVEGAPVLSNDRHNRWLDSNAQ